MKIQSKTARLILAAVVTTMSLAGISAVGAGHVSPANRGGDHSWCC